MLKYHNSCVSSTVCQYVSANQCRVARLKFKLVVRSKGNPSRYDEGDRITGGELD